MDVLRTPLLSDHLSYGIPCPAKKYSGLFAWVLAGFLILGMLPTSLHCALQQMEKVETAKATTWSARNITVVQRQQIGGTTAEGGWTEAKADPGASILQVAAEFEGSQAIDAKDIRITLRGKGKTLTVSQMRAIGIKGKNGDCVYYHLDPLYSLGTALSRGLYDEAANGFELAKEKNVASVRVALKKSPSYLCLAFNASVEATEVTLHLGSTQVQLPEPQK
jgi:hypothetical protein